MSERHATIASSSGLHARPAQLFVKAARETGIPVRIRREGRDAVDAGSILGVMGLGAAQGTEVILSAEGPGADDALERLVQLIETNLDKDA